MYHISIYLSVDGCLGCFHVLAIVKSAITTPGVHVSFWIMIFLGYMPRSRIVSSSSVQFSRSVVFESLWPQGLQHARLLCPSLSPGICSNSCPLSPWCHPTISSSVVLFSFCLQSFLCQPLLLPSIFPSIRVFSSESALHIRWPKYCSFSFILLCRWLQRMK